MCVHHVSATPPLSDGCVDMTAVVEKNVMMCCDMRLDLLIFLGQRVYDDDVRFDASLIFFFPFISLSYASIFTLSMKKNIVLVLIN